MKTEFERRKEKNIPTISADFDGLWRELVTTFKSERVYLREVGGKSYSPMRNHFGGIDLVESIFAVGHSGSTPFTYQEISNKEYNELVSAFERGMFMSIGLEGRNTLKFIERPGLRWFNLFLYGV